MATSKWKRVNALIMYTPNYSMTVMNLENTLIVIVVIYHFQWMNSFWGNKASGKRRWIYFFFPVANSPEVFVLKRILYLSARSLRCHRTIFTGLAHQQCGFLSGPSPYCVGRGLGSPPNEITADRERSHESLHIIPSDALQITIQSWF